jgi:hypothetical protein
MSKITIPKISDEMLQMRASRIRPLLTFDGELYSIVPTRDLRSISFMWNPIRSYRAGPLRQLADVRMFHSFGAPSLFKPTIAEVIAQIPERYSAVTCAFEVIRHPQNAADLNLESEALNAGFHVSIVRLYTL